MTTLPIYIGYDSRQQESYKACVQSIEVSTSNTIISPIKHKDMRDLGIFTRQWRISDTGQFYDAVDNKSFSTEFSHTRFLVPELAKISSQSGLVMFCDSDFIFTESLTKLFEQAADPSKALFVVKQAFPFVMGDKKMDGMKQETYPRKLWSSLMIFNTDHKSNNRLDVKRINTTTGRSLHNFDWLANNEIGELTPEWNYVPGLSTPCRDPNGVHFSLGGPWMEAYKECEYADLWRFFYKAALHKELAIIK